MTAFAFPPPAVPSAAISGSDQRFAVHRIYCVGRNYADHVREMGGDTEREPPVFFSKPADAVMASDAAIPYPPRTSNFHHEIELVIAIARGGRDIRKDRHSSTSSATPSATISRGATCRRPRWSVQRFAPRQA